MIRAVAVCIALVLASACSTSALSGARYDVEWFDDAQAVPAEREPSSNCSPGAGSTPSKSSAKRLATTGRPPRSNPASLAVAGRHDHFELRSTADRGRGSRCLMEGGALFVPLTGLAPCGTSCVVYGEPAAEQTVWLVARGPFDGDGIDDVLLASSDAAKGGSYQSLRMFVLTRRQAEGKVELIQQLDC